MGCKSELRFEFEPELVLIPEGWFWMGSELGQDNERPVHRVWVDAFLLAARQTTNSEYAVFLNATDHERPPWWGKTEFDHSQQPVVGVSWFDAVAYCAWLGQITGRRYRLPTEAEWERAARGGREGLLYPWGNEANGGRAGTQTRPHDSRRQSGPEPVGSGPPNGYGLYDMCTNVHEWCADWYDAGYYAIAPDRNPQGPETGTRRSSRGGSWRHRVQVSRCAARSSIPPGLKYADYGFRTACDPEET
jgi:formylglycine-generating enzyme required for sulfatase activity